MFLRNDFNNLLSRFITNFEQCHNKRSSEVARNSRSDRGKPLAQIVESKFSQRQPGKEAKLTVATRIALASEVGPPPLTPAAFRR